MYNSFNSSAEGVAAAVREEWFAAAARGAHFLEKAKRADGALFFSTSREGAPLHFQRKPFTAVFYILGCLEFAKAVATRRAEGIECSEDADLFLGRAEEMFAKFRSWLDDPTLLGRPKMSESNSSNLGEVMCLAGLSEEFIDKLPHRRQYFLPFVNDAMRRVVKHFDAERQILMENVDKERGVLHDSMAGLIFNPGHSIEVTKLLYTAPQHPHGGNRWLGSFSTSADLCQVMNANKWLSMLSKAR